jgi:hypothetical protein
MVAVATAQRGARCFGQQSALISSSSRSLFHGLDFLRNIYHVLHYGLAGFWSRSSPVQEPGKVLQRTQVPLSAQRAPQRRVLCPDPDAPTAKRQCIEEAEVRCCSLVAGYMVCVVVVGGAVSFNSY